jgi:hypothetical protein
MELFKTKKAAPPPETCPLHTSLAEYKNQWVKN